MFGGLRGDGEAGEHLLMRKEDAVRTVLVRH